MSVTAEEDEDTDTGPVYVGTTYDSGDTDISAPSIGGTDYTTYGTEVRVLTGYVILYGSDLTSLYTATTVNCTYCSVSYESQNQINLYYSIPVDTASATLTNDIDVNVAMVGMPTRIFNVYLLTLHYVGYAIYVERGYGRVGDDWRLLFRVEQYHNS